MSMASNLKTLRVSHGMNQKEFGDIAGVTDKAVSTWESGEKMPRMGAIQRISDYFGISKSVILDDGDNTDRMRYAIPVPQMKRIPVLGHIHAGVPLLAEEHLEGYDYADVPNEHGYFYLRVDGDCMEGAGIKEGMLVLVRSQNWADDGQIVACLINGDEAVLRRFHVQGDGVILAPENYKYSPQLISKKEFDAGYARILGVAIEFKGKL